MDMFSIGMDLITMTYKMIIKDVKLISLYEMK